MLAAPRKLNALVLVISVSLLACGGVARSNSLHPDAGDESRPDAGQAQPQIARVEITPGAILFTAAGESQALSARAFDAEGNTVQVSIAWTSSSPSAVAVSADGRARALASSGSSKIVASAGAVRSAPVLALVAKPAPNAVLVDDAQIIDEPANEDVGKPIVLGSRFRVTLSGVAAPPPGAIVIGRGGKGLAGKVVSSSEQGGRVTATLQMVALNKVFERLRVEEDLELDRVEPLVDQASGVTVERQDGGWVSSAEADAASPAATRRSAFRASAGLETKFKLGPFDCKAEGNAVEVKAKFSVKLETKLSFPIKIDLDGFEIKYLRLLAQGSVVAKTSADIALVLGLEGQLKCKYELGSIPIPVGGALSFLVQPVVPYGVGFKLKGKADLPLLGVGVEGKLGAEVKLGFEYSQAAGFKDLSDFNVVRNFKVKGNYPTEKGVRVELTADAFAYATLSVAAFNTGFKPIDEFIQKRGDILEGTFGLRQEMKLALPQDQAKDRSYASEYSLKLRAALEVAGDLKKLIESIGGTLNSAELKLFELEFLVSHSPTSTDFAPDKASVVAGEAVHFSLDLNDLTYLGFSNVEAVQIFELKAGLLNLPALLPFRALPGVSGQTRFSADWLTSTSDVGEHQFVAFVTTKVFPILPLELDADTIRKVTVSAPSTTRTITAPNVSIPCAGKSVTVSVGPLDGPLASDASGTAGVQDGRIATVANGTVLFHASTGMGEITFRGASEGTTTYQVSLRQDPILYQGGGTITVSQCPVSSGATAYEVEEKRVVKTPHVCTDMPNPYYCISSDGKTCDGRSYPMEIVVGSDGAVRLSNFSHVLIPAGKYQADTRSLVMDFAEFFYRGTEVGSGQYPVHFSGTLGPDGKLVGPVVLEMKVPGNASYCAGDVETYEVTWTPKRVWYGSTLDAVFTQRCPYVVGPTSWTQSVYKDGDQPSVFFDNIFGISSFVQANIATAGALSGEATDAHMTVKLFNGTLRADGSGRGEFSVTHSADGCVDAGTFTLTPLSPVILSIP